MGVPVQYIKGRTGRNARMQEMKDRRTQFMSGFFSHSSSRRRYPNPNMGGGHYKKKGLFGMMPGLGSFSGSGSCSRQGKGYSNAGQMRCPRCGASVPAGSKFCLSCGEKIESNAAFCMNCGKPLPPGARFCPECGTPASR